MQTVVYSIPHPYANGRVEVIGDPYAGCWEYRIVESELVVRQSRSEYGNSAIALRDALIDATA